jgi:protoporphyrinogen oxidase
VQNLVKELLDGNLSTINRRDFIYSNGVFTRYPFQANLHGLPPKVIKECLQEFVKAYYKNEDLPSSAYQSFADWIRAKLGKGMGKHFMFPYNEKIWTVSTEELTCEWLSEYVPRPSLEDVFTGAFFDQKKAFGYNATFDYPQKGGIQALCDAFAGRVENLRLNERVTAVFPGNRSLELASGSRLFYEYLVSTLPLKKLIEDIIVDAPSGIKEAAAKLRHNSLLIVNLGVRGKGLTDKHWVYIPEKKFTAYRVGVYSNFSPDMAPAGTTSYYVEVAYQKARSLDKKQTVERAVSQMQKMGFVPDIKNILVHEVFDVDCAYVIYDRNYSKCREVILDYLRGCGIHSIGRYGAWEYTGMEEAVQQGKSVIDHIKKRQGIHE